MKQKTLTKRQKLERGLTADAPMVVTPTLITKNKPGRKVAVGTDSNPYRKRKVIPKRPSVLPDRTLKEIVKFKQEILELLGKGEAKTLTNCADALGISPLEVHRWYENDRDWSNLVKIAKEIVADGLEEELMLSHNDVAKIFLLKGYRPMFRDNYRFVEIRDEDTKTLLRELRELGMKPPADKSVPVPAQVKVVNPLAETIRRIQVATLPTATRLPLPEDEKEST